MVLFTSIKSMLQMMFFFFVFFFVTAGPERGNLCRPQSLHVVDISFLHYFLSSLSIVCVFKQYGFICVSRYLSADNSQKLLSIGFLANVTP